MTAPAPRGMLTLDELRAKIAAGEIETVLAVFPDLYGRFLGKRIAGDFFLDQIAASGMHACDYLLTVDMEMDVVDGYDFASWEKGFSDFHCVPDFSTLREATDELAASAMLREAFGSHVVDHYVHFFRTEQRKYDEAVTSWERARYLERG